MTTQYFLGCSGFYYNHWNGLFYPQGLPKTKWLQYYADHFSTVEVNSTFYRFPKETMVRGWYNKTPETFKFTLKASRTITHRAKFNRTEKFTANFYKVASLLQKKLLSVLFQLPPFMQKDMELLEKMANQLEPNVTNVLEFRHESWWDKEVFDFMKKKSLVFCSVSASGLPETIVQTAPITYIRFHGKNGWYQYNYPDSELKDWAEKIKDLKTQKVICYFNNDYQANAVKNCLTLKKSLGN